MISGLIRKLFIVAVFALGVFLAFRFGLIPQRYSPIPPIDLAKPTPLVLDWQLAMLAKDRGLCAGLITQNGIEARPIDNRVFDRGCGWENAVSILRISDAQVRVSAVSCAVAAGLALWMRHVVQPEAVRLFGAQVVEVRQLGTFACRNVRGSQWFRNRRSQHATANAIDIAAFRLSNGEMIEVLRDWPTKGPKAEFLRNVHRGACRYFRVTLGPDYNAAHENHFHFDRGPFWRCR